MIVDQTKAEKLTMEKISQMLEETLPFQIRPTYSVAGDCVEVFMEDADHYAEYVNCWLTVYKAFSDKRIVGIQINNISKVISRS